MRGNVREASSIALRGAFQFLKSDPLHLSVGLKRAGQHWYARIGRSHRAVAVEIEDGLVWIWIGRHGPYERKFG